MRRLATFSLLAALGLSCVSKGDTTITEDEQGGVETCETVCDHLQAETFNDCAKWTDFQDCIFECQDHAPTDTGLQCAADAQECDAFSACDSTYDLF